MAADQVVVSDVRDKKWLAILHMHLEEIYPSHEFLVPLQKPFPLLHAQSPPPGTLLTLSTSLP